MPLDPAYKTLMSYFKSLPKFKDFKSAAEYRSAINSIFEERVKILSQQEPVKCVEDIKIGRGIRIRVYQEKPNSPVLVYFHGGGFVICSIETHDAVCRRIARLSKATVISVDYRLAPENKFPAAVEDCYEATKWVYENSREISVDNSKIIVGGDSAGGNLAAAVSIKARDEGEKFIKHQVLIYPVLNLFGKTPSLYEFGEDNPVLDHEIMVWFTEQYIQRKEDTLNPLASPILADLSNLPPALIITAQYDPLRDEGELFGHLLRRAGVEASVVRYNGVYHGFINYYPVLKAGRDAINQIASLLLFD